MGILARERHPFSLNYRGKHCGGCNLPFDTLTTAIAYAKERGATFYRIEAVEMDGTSTPVAAGQRQDGRFAYQPIDPSTLTEASE